MQKLPYLIILCFALLLLNRDAHPIYAPQPSALSEFQTTFPSVRQLYHNPDIIARLEIPYLFNIYLPLTTDNTYYLNHNLEQQHDIKGHPFIDYRTPPASYQINIYGHNSTTFDLPFAKLTNYLDYEYFAKHNIIYLETPNQTKIFHLFLLTETATTTHLPHHSSPPDIISSLSYHPIHYFPVTYTTTSELLIIQTCTMKNPPSYYLFIAIRI